MLHDPPGDQSYAYFEDTMTVSGVIAGMKIQPKNGSAEIPVYPAPWSVEREINGVTFGNDNAFQDLKNTGLLNREDSPFSAGMMFGKAVGAQLVFDAKAVALAGAGIILANSVPAAILGGGAIGIFGGPAVALAGAAAGGLAAQFGGPH